jgi:Ca2+-binding EF-hand superfamily protein
MLSCAVTQSLFMSMDKDDDGRLSAADLHRAIEQVGAHTAAVELVELLMLP